MQCKSLEVMHGESEAEDSLKRGNVTHDGEGLWDDSVRSVHRERSSKQGND